MRLKVCWPHVMWADARVFIVSTGWISIQPSTSHGGVYLVRRLAFQLADRVLSVSYRLRDLHVQRTGFPARKITVIHNGVDSDRFAPDRAARARVRREWGLADDEFCIGCVGNLIPVKDHLTLLQAVDRFSACGRPWRLVIVGDGPERAKLTTFVNERALARSGTVHGKKQPCTRLTKRSGRICLVVSHRGNFELSFGSDGDWGASGGIRHWRKSGSGRRRPVGSAVSGRRGWASGGTLLALEAQRDLRRMLGETASRRVREEFSMNSMVRKYEEIYEHLGSVGATAVRAIAKA